MKKKIVFLTGSGISKESGIPTFRDSADGVWENFNILEVCTEGCFSRDPEKAYGFYTYLHEKYKSAKPNQAHLDIAALENNFDVTVITQNVDNLHEEAGSSNVLHLHGDITKIRAVDDPGLLWDWDSSVIMHEDTIIEGHHIRPHIVMFGEDVPEISRAIDIIHEADFVVIIGTSLQVYPAAGLLDYIRYDAPVYYIDPHPAKSPEHPWINILEMKAIQGMKEINKILYADNM